jgi:predicted outer membrane repeat protein
MKAMRVFGKAALGTGAALLVVALAPATIASASPLAFVPCPGPGGGAGGLVAAITAANHAGGGTINLTPGCTYNLKTANNTHPASPPGSMKPSLGANGLPIITSPITINGLFTTIAGNNTTFRIFEVDGPDGNLTLRGLTIRGGNTTLGGGIFNDEGTVTLDYSNVTGNTGAQGGGGIVSGIGPDHPNDLGPIGTLTLNVSQVTDNTVTTGPMSGGGGILNHAGTATLNFSRVNNNTSSGGGGGIASGTGNGGAAGNSVLMINFSQVNGNTSNGGPNDGAGGLSNGGTATINFSQVNNNSAPGAAGGGIQNHGTMTINVSEVDGNKALSDTIGETGAGGGIANINVDLALGITTPSGVLTINLSEVHDNTTSSVGGGILDVGINADGSPTAPAGALTLKLALVAGNSASLGGGGIYATSGSPVALNLSLVVGNTPDNCFPVATINGCHN